MASLPHAGTAMLGVARREDFERLREEWRGVRLLEVDRVRGVDAGHVRWEEQILFRMHERRSRRDGAGVDRHGVPP
jgi:hypothetical protein